MNPDNKITQSQKMMVFVLSMSLYGLATLFTELIPSFQVGIVEFSVEYFLFIPLTLAMLFDPLSAGCAKGQHPVLGEERPWAWDVSECRTLEEGCRSSCLACLPGQGLRFPCFLGKILYSFGKE